jgi:hypothetical protein
MLLSLPNSMTCVAKIVKNQIRQQYPFPFGYFCPTLEYAESMNM